LTTYTGIGKIDRGDSVCILDGPRIQVAQPRYGFTTGFRGMTDIPYWSYCHFHYHWHIFIVIDYLEVGPGLESGDWAVVPGMYGTHLKHG